MKLRSALALCSVGSILPVLIFAAALVYDSYRRQRESIAGGRRRREAEAALRQSVANLATAERRAKLGSWELDPHTQTGWWSEEMFRLFERHRENGVPHFEEFLEMVHRENRVRIEETHTRVIESGEDSEVAFRASLPSGRERHFSAIIGAVKDGSGRVVKLAGTVQDVTERKAAEDRTENSLRESEERFRQLAENIEEVFWLATPDNSQVIYVSPGYEKIWRRSRQSLYDSPGDWFAAIHPDDRARVLEASRREQQSGTYDQEYRVVRPDGTVRWVRDRAFPVRDVNGKVYRIAGIAEDISDVKFAEETLRRIHVELEQRVNERTRELQEANLKLRDLDRLKSEFLANMSHELRTPLNAIIGFSQLMHDGKAGGPPSSEQKEYLADILSSARHLLQLINDVLDVSKLEAGRMEVLPSTFQIDDVILEVVQNVSTIMTVKGLKLVREIPAGLPPLTTDRRKLLQILLNLASNAVKFTDQGEIGLRCEITERRMRIGVSDTGIGIKPDEMDLLFRPFSQLDSGLRKRHEGTGLGLYLAKKLAIALGGDLTVASAHGKGSTFTLTIPLAV